MEFLQKLDGGTYWKTSAWNTYKQMGS